MATLDPKPRRFCQQVVTVTGTTATIYLNVFKPNTTMTVYYGTQQPTECNPGDPQPPWCMQPFPNYGFLNMLQASYPNSSQPGVEVQDPIALSEGITNIYDETVTITGLQPNTTYHWRPLTTDANGNMAAYHDQELYHTGPISEVAKTGWIPRPSQARIHPISFMPEVT